MLCQALTLEVAENSKLLMSAGVLQVVGILHDQSLFKYTHTHIHTCPYCKLGTTLDHLWETIIIPELCGNTIILKRGNG